MTSNLLLKRKFQPLFITQFLGAFNDNFFKNALAILITYRAYGVGGLDPKMMVALASALFILPFFLFSAVAGQLADRYSKSKIAYWTKVWEVAVMAVGACGMLFGHIPLLLFTLFMMGMQSAFFGPVKYSLLPELLEREELVKGNALVEMGTFVAILLGTVSGGILISLPVGGALWVSVVIVGLSILGTWTSAYIPHRSSKDPSLKIDWNLISATFAIIKKSKREKSIWLSIMGISWFWAIGALFITIIPLYGKEVLKLHPIATTLLLAIFSVGIGIGSMICEKLSHGRLEVGILPIGTIGMSLAAIDLYSFGIPSIPIDAGASISEFFFRPYAWRVIMDLFILSAFGGLFIVPLYTLIQLRAKETERAQIIAANNILNSLFMVLASVALMIFFSFKRPFVESFLWIGYANLFIACIIYFMVPEFFYRFICYLMTQAMYRVKLKGDKYIPLSGAAIIVANHVSFIDWLLLLAISPRPIRFVMHRQYYQMPLLRWFFKQNKLIEIASPLEDRQTFLRSFSQIAEHLDNGELICIFPEGEITRSGQLGEFKRGLIRVLDKHAVPVIPIYIGGMWGSIFSRGKQDHVFFRLWSPISITVGMPLLNPTLEQISAWMHLQKKESR